MPAKPVSTTDSAETELAQLRAEVSRLRELIGPNEQSYVQLRIDVWSARDAVIGAEAEMGLLRGQVQSLHAEVDRAMKEQQWVKDEVLLRIKSWRTYFWRLVLKIRRMMLR